MKKSEFCSNKSQSPGAMASIDNNVVAVLALAKYKRLTSFCILDYWTHEEQNAFLKAFIDTVLQRGASLHDVASIMYLLGFFGDHAFQEAA